MRPLLSPALTKAFMLLSPCSSPVPFAEPQGIPPNTTNLFFPLLASPFLQIVPESAVLGVLDLLWGPPPAPGKG